jgi:diadenylate cyclase
MEILRHIWTLGLVHVVDVALVTILLYRMLLLVRGTRTEQVLWGLVMLLVFTVLSRHVLNLPTMGWLLENFWTSAVLILVVVFQPELRSALANLGTQPWGKILAPSGFEFIHEIIEAVKVCAEKHTGALIVLEQDTGLRNFIETGTTINGEITQELLLSIFNTRAPLHDGAVIIANDRIVAAGCLLPLSNDASMAKILGTRHRAAVGLTEISDALVVVVSEETATIYISRNGKLERGIEPEELERQLFDLYRSRSQRSLLRKNAFGRVNT